MPTQPPKMQTQFIQVPVSYGQSIKLVYTQSGCGPPILLLHGLGLSSKTWQKNLTFLEQHGTVFALDLPGFGQSEDPQEAWGTQQLAQITAAYLKVLKLAPVVAIGHSLGGEVCLWLAYVYPTGVQALILAATPGPAPSLPQRALGMVLDMFLEPPRFMPRLYLAYYQAGLIRVIKTLQKSDTATLVQNIQKITLPVLLINGRLDPVVKIAEGRLWQQRLGGAKLTIINAAHGLIFSNPEAFNRACTPFLLKNL